jgi:2-methylisocitrate lyase-like PEP mutase family enzyme
MTTADPRARFAALHAGPGIFVMPNAWDVGSARLLASQGFQALATTSSGFAWSIGKEDQRVTRDELLAHVEAVAAATPLPLSVDSERLYADDLAGVGESVRLLAEAGAAGCSIEDYDPATQRLETPERAAERVGAAAEAARSAGLVLTARAENHLYGVDDLDDTIGRLRAYRAAGADVVYAPGLRDRDAIAAVVAATDAPVNVLGLPGCPTVAELGALGVRRVSTGGALAKAAYGALVAAARELAGSGTFDYARGGVTAEERAAAFASG